MASPEQPSSGDKPFDDEPFDAGVEADEQSDPKKYIEQLTGKLGQSLRKYTESLGHPDFDLEKFAINSLLSATHTSEMDSNDQDDIIGKVKSAGNSEEGHEERSDDEVDVDVNSDNVDIDFEDDTDVNVDDEVDENIIGEDEVDGMILDNPKKCNMFQPNSNDILTGEVKVVENLNIEDKRSIFDRNTIKMKLQETFNQEDSTETPVVEPKTKPKTEPKVAPSRKNRPFAPQPSVDPDPKANA